MQTSPTGESFYLLPAQYLRLRLKITITYWRVTTNLPFLIVNLNELKCAADGIKKAAPLFFSPPILP